ncbi:HDOD domain-containing protein [Nibricoccus sp. IMCC34717]|uniref:HDOD domain-containing protein n=1 Tax=Nibricoccus sp. IMCC34717 TaxID=3034021 RepID=UPI00384B534B
MVSTALSIRDQVVRQAQQLPAAPQIFTRLTLLLEEDGGDIEQVQELVTLDPALAGQVLLMANSVYYRGESGVSSIRDAVARMGVAEVHRAVGIAMTAKLFGGGLVAYGMTAETMWSNAVAGALAMECLARHAGTDLQEAYTVGLLRQIGKLALANILKGDSSSQRCPEDGDLHAWERARFGITNLEATAEILRAWKLPAHLEEAIRFSHDLSCASRNRVSVLIHLSNWVVEQLNLCIPIERGIWRLTPATCEQAGLTEALVQSAIDETATEWRALKALMMD